MAQHWTRIILGLFTLFVYLSWPRKKVFPLIIATTLIEDMGTVLQLPEKETEAPGKRLPSQKLPDVHLYLKQPSDSYSTQKWL